MKVREGKFFHEIATGSICDSVVILDIDGTLMCGSHCDADANVVDAICELQKRNRVYVFSNNYNGVRSRKIAKKLKLPYIESPYKKPNKKILNYIESQGRPIIVIGDKYLTDGLFAQFIGANQIRVKRYRCQNDSFADRAACLFDDCIYAVAKFLRIAK